MQVVVGELIRCHVEIGGDVVKRAGRPACPRYHAGFTYLHCSNESAA